MTDGIPGRQTAATKESHPGDHQAPGRHRVPLSMLWFGVAGGPLAWSTHTVAAAALNSHGCIAIGSSAPPTGVHSGSATWIVLSAITVLMLLVAGAALAVAIRSWRRTQVGGEAGEVLEVGEGRTRFMAMAGILLSSVFVIVLVANGITLALVSQCWP